MDDIIKIILMYLRNEYGSQDAMLIIGYKVNIEPRIRFTLPNYHLLAEFSAKELMMVYKAVGTDGTLKVLDESIEKMLLEYRKKFPEGF